MKKAEINLRSFMISILIVCGILVTFGTVAVNMAADYDSISDATVDEDFVSTYDKISEISGTTKDMQNKLEQADVGDEDSNAQFYGGVVAVLKLPFNLLGAVLQMITGFIGALSIPYPWNIILPTAIIITLVSLITYAILGR